MSPPDPPDWQPPAQYPPAPPLAPPPSPAPPGALRATGSWPGPPEEDPVPERRVPFWVVGVAIVAVGALLGGLAAVITRDDDREDATTTPTEPEQPTSTEPPTTGSTSTTAPADLATVVQEIEAFVAAERGLPFLREVTVELAEDAEFEQRLLADFEEDVDELQTSGRVLQALGLVPPGTDVVESFRAILGAGVVGFYDSATDELVVRGGAPTPYVRSVIAHELVHALDDQHFELERPALEEADDESPFGFTALVEGNASRIEQIYRATFTAAEEADARAEEMAISAGYDLNAMSLTLLESVLAPYVLGPELVTQLLDDGGQARLDAAFAAPPTTSEALLDPPTFIEGQPTVPVLPPVADGPEFDRNVLGAMGLAQVLGVFTPVVGGIGEVPESVLGWGGDAYVAWDDGSRACVRVNIVGDSAQDTEEIGDALEEWAASAPFSVDAQVERGDVVVLTSCG